VVVEVDVGVGVSVLEVLVVEAGAVAVAVVDSILGRCCQTTHHPCTYTEMYVHTATPY